METKKFNKLFAGVGIDPEDIDTKRITTKVDKPNGKFQVFQSVALQCDLIFMPKDHGYIYILSVVDLHNKECDAEPLKSKTAETLKEAFTKVFNRNIINSANVKEIYSDLGTEFTGGIIQDFFKKHNILIKFSRTNRHSQQAVVEHMNYILKKVLWSKMSIEEQKTGKTNTTWVKYLPKLIKMMNENKQKEKPIKYYFNDPKIKKNEKILSEGTEVYVMRDFPVDNIQGKRLYGNIRAGEAKFDTVKRKINRVCIYPNQPVRYQVSGIENASYSRGQLLLA